MGGVRDNIIVIVLFSTILIMLLEIKDVISTAEKSLTLHYDHKFRNKVPVASSTFQKTETDLSDCAVHCMQDSACMTIFYGTTNHVCHGYNKIMNEDEEFVQTGGYIVYSSNQDCESLGFVKVYGICFKLMGKADWHTARGTCQSLGGDLLTLKTEDKYQKFISLTNVEETTYWIGLSDTASEGVWLWIDDTSAAGFNQFNPSQPNNIDYLSSNEADCGMLPFTSALAYTKYQVYDDDCSRQQNFICELLRG